MALRFGSNYESKLRKFLLFYVICRQLTQHYMLLIFSHTANNRLKYITSLVLKEMLGVNFRITQSVPDYVDFNGPKICYGDKSLHEGIFIAANQLLFESKVYFHEMSPAWIDGMPVLFETANPDSALKFDPLAAAFYMVSRYEEYHTHKKDSFGRYQATESIAWKGEFLEIPVVHLWAEALASTLMTRYPEIQFHRPSYRFVPTIDIDHAWCYRGRPVMRTLGGFARSFMHFRFQEIFERTSVLAGFSPDPYDNYDFIEEQHHALTGLPLYFILFADYGTNDNNVKVTGENFHKLIRKLDQTGRVGIHPSLSSNKHLPKLESEYKGLGEVLNRKVTISRQHFLKLSMPRTYNSLVRMGVTDDYSMGYASHPGFRAGIAIPFQFYDLTRDVLTPLIVHPVALMDVTLKDYLRLSRVKSLEKIKEMVHTIRNVNGEFVSLWHNESLGDHGRWKGWRHLYQEMVKLASD